MLEVMLTTGPSNTTAGGNASVHITDLEPNCCERDGIHPGGDRAREIAFHRAMT